MADIDAARRAIEATIDPLLGRPIGELGYLEDLKGRLTGGLVASVRVPVPGGEQSAVVAAVGEAVRAAGVAKSIQVEARLMTDAERAELMTRLRDAARPVTGQGAKTRIISVGSGKGGVGKSSVTANLAVTLAQKGHQVGVIDADVWGFSIPKMLGAEGAPAVVAENIIPIIAHGVKVMSMDYFVPADQAVIWRGPMLHKALEQFLNDVFWDEPDFLLIDMPPGTGDVAISISQFLPRAELLLVTTPQPTAQRVAKRAALMATQVNQSVMGVVENMSWFTGDDAKRYPIFGEGGGRLLADELGVELMAQIPLLADMREGADQGVPVALAAPGSDVEAAFQQLADAVIAKRPKLRTHPELIIR